MLQSSSMVWPWPLHMVDVSRDVARREFQLTESLVEGLPLPDTILENASSRGGEIFSFFALKPQVKPYEQSDF